MTPVNYRASNIQANKGNPQVQASLLFLQVRFLNGWKQLENNSEETHLSNDAEPVFFQYI